MLCFVDSPYVMLDFVYWFEGNVLVDRNFILELPPALEVCYCYYFI